MGFIFWLMFRKRKELKEDPEEVLILIAFVCFLVATYFNPWMNAAIGISWYGRDIAVLINASLLGVFSEDELQAAKRLDAPRIRQRSEAVKAVSLTAAAAAYQTAAEK